MPFSPDDTILSIEERALAAWPALESEPFHGWVFRHSAGYTKRANSANALAPDAPLKDVMAAAEDFYARRGLPTIFRLTPLSGPDADGALAQAGYAHLDDSLVMTAPVPDDTAADGAEDPAVTLRIAPEPAWCDGFAAANAVPEAGRATHDRILEAIPAPAVFATLEEAGRDVAYGVAVVQGGMVGLFDIVVHTDCRRRGLGQRLVAALLAWGRREGAVTAYLQVVEANAGARRLYESLGFGETYRYHYRIRPRQG